VHLALQTSQLWLQQNLSKKFFQILNMMQQPIQDVNYYFFFSIDAFVCRENLHCDFLNIS